MSIITWDGRYLAADRAAVISDTIRVTKKLHQIGEHIVGFTGGLEEGLTLCEWVKGGMRHEDWPKFQSTDSWCRLILLREKEPRRFELLFFEKLPCGVVDLNMPAAYGCGMQFALGAMAAGANAIDAVKVAIKLDPYCGQGIDYFDTQCGRWGRIECNTVYGGEMVSKSDPAYVSKWTDDAAERLAITINKIAKEEMEARKNG